jgi:hypothetical protein
MVLVDQASGGPVNARYGADWRLLRALDHILVTSSTIPTIAGRKTGARLKIQSQYCPYIFLVNCLALVHRSTIDSHHLALHAVRDHPLLVLPSPLAWA